MEVYVLFDEEYGECQVFLELETAKAYFGDEVSGWKQHKKDKTLWLSKNEFVYIFRREING